MHGAVPAPMMSWWHMIHRVGRPATPDVFDFHTGREFLQAYDAHACLPPKVRFLSCSPNMSALAGAKRVANQAGRKVFVVRGVRRGAARGGMGSSGALTVRGRVATGARRLIRHGHACLRTCTADTVKYQCDRKMWLRASRIRRLCVHTRRPQQPAARADSKNGAHPHSGELVYVRVCACGESKRATRGRSRPCRRAARAAARASSCARSRQREPQQQPPPPFDSHEATARARRKCWRGLVRPIGTRGRGRARERGSSGTAPGA